MAKHRFWRLQMGFFIIAGLLLLPFLLVGSRIQGHFRLQSLRRKLRGPKKRETIEVLRRYSDSDIEIMQEMGHSYKEYLKPVADFCAYVHLGSTFSNPNRLEELQLLPKSSEVSPIGRAYLRRLKQVYGVLIEFDEDKALWESHLAIIEKKLES